MLRRARRVAVILVLTALLVWGASAARHALVARFGPERGVLVSAWLTGVIFFVATLSVLQWAERWQERRSPGDDADSPDATGRGAGTTDG